MADGDARLEIVIGARLDRLEEKLGQANRASGNWARRTEQQIDSVDRRWQQVTDRMGRANARLAGASIFTEAQNRTLAQGAARLGAVGAGLEHLGAVGLIAAAGIAATVFALSQAREAAAFADNIADTADRLHVTTDALQEYRYAVRAAGGEEAGADQALQAFSVTLGNAQGGLRRALQVFRSVGFTPEQVRSFHDTDEALRAVTGRINQLSTSAQRDSAIQRFGLEGMSQLINQNVDGMQRLRDEAHRMGVVMDAELVRRGGELNDQFETLERVIAVQLHSAFVDLGPVLLTLLGYLADMARFVADIADTLRSVEQRTTRTLESRRIDLVGQIQADQATVRSGRVGLDRSGQVPVTGVTGGDTGIQMPSFVGPSEAQDRIARNLRDLAQIDAELARRADLDRPSRPTGDRNLTPPAGRTPHAARTPHTPQDTFAQQSAQLDRSIAAAQRDYLQAQIDATDSITERGRLQRDVLAQEAAAATAQINAEQAHLDQNRTINTTERGILQGKIDQLRAVQGQITTQRQANALAAEAVAQAQADLEARATLGDLRTRERDAQADISTSARERYRLEIDSLLARQGQESEEFALRQRELVDRRAITQAVADERLAALEAAQTAELHAQQNRAFRQANPLYDFGHPTDDLNTDMQNVAVRGLGSLNDGLVQAIMNTKSLGQVFHEIASQIIADLLRIAIQRNITQPLANALFGGGGPGAAVGGGLGEIVKSAAKLFIPKFASGTDFAPGGLAYVHKDELINLPRGSQVINAANARAMAQVAGAGGRGHTVVQPIFNDFRGAVMTEDLLRQANANARQAAAQMGQTTLALAKRQAPGWVSQRQAEGR